MQLDELARERQAQARAFALVQRVISHLPKLLEDRLVVLGRDPNAGISDGNLDRTIDQGGPHVDLPAVSVFRAREIAISSDRPFTMYADGDPIGELPVRVRALAGAITMLTPAGTPPDSPFSA